MVPDVALRETCATTHSASRTLIREPATSAFCAIAYNLRLPRYAEQQARARTKLLGHCSTRQFLGRASPFPGKRDFEVRESGAETVPDLGGARHLDQPLNKAIMHRSLHEQTRARNAGLPGHGVSLFQFD